MGHSGAVECGDGGHRRAVGASAKTVRCRDVSPAIRHGMPLLVCYPRPRGFHPLPLAIFITDLSWCAVPIHEGSFLGVEDPRSSRSMAEESRALIPVPCES